MLLWQSEKETAITRVPQCEKGRTGFKAQKDNCIYGIDAEGANISFFVFLIIFLFNNDDLAAGGLAVSIEQIAKYINAWYLLDFH